jgi:hypothetical protein
MFLCVQVVAAYVFWERDEAASLLSDIMGVASAATDTKELLAKAAAMDSRAAAATVEEIAKAGGWPSSATAFAQRVRCTCTDNCGRAAVETAMEARAAAFGDLTSEGYAMQDLD